MVIFKIEIVCISLWHMCTVMPPAPQSYPTKEDCERALLEIARNWKPISGGYTFNCRRDIEGDAAK